MCMTSFAQLRLLHTFESQIGQTFDNGLLGVITIEANKYYYDKIEGEMIYSYIYNADFSLNNSFSVRVNNLPQGYTLYSCKFLSNNFINTDNKNEWLIVANNSSASASQNRNQFQYVCIINSDGEIVYNLGYCYFFSSMTFHIANGQLRASVVKSSYDEGNNSMNYFTEIYSCGGNYNRVTESKIEKATDAYPNPATSFINLPYELNEGETSTMNIYDINGRLIEQRPIGYHFGNIELNVSCYKAGTYIYEYNGKSNRFIVQ